MSRGVLLYLVGVLGVLVVANQAVAAAALPDYGTWTGLRPLETKLRLLTRFAEEGPVDAVVVGSSIADMGFSAERYSALMSAHHDRPYRAFNFSTGGAEVASLPNLYRLMRTVATPDTLLVVIPAGIRRGEGVLPHMPDSALEQAPISRALRHQWLLNLEKQLWDQPLIRFASPIRDQVLHGAYRNFQAQGVDLYRVSEYGDRVGYGFESTVPEIRKLRELFEEQLAEPENDGANLQRYFNKTDIEAMAELRALTSGDGIEIVIIANAPAALVSEAPIQDEGYLRRIAAYFDSMASALDAPVVFALEDFWVPRYATGDTNHINMYGARLFTEWVTAAMLGRSPIPGSLDAILAQREWPTPDLTRIGSGDRSVNRYAGVVVREHPDQGTTLVLEIVQDHTRTRIPDGRLFMGLRLSNDEDLVVRAERISDDTVQATFRKLPPEPGQVFLARVLQRVDGEYVAPDLPLSRYTWTSR